MLNDTLPNSLRTYDIALANGELLGSFSNDSYSFIPQIPELFIFRWAFSLINENKNCTSLEDDLSILKKRLRSC